MFFQFCMEPSYVDTPLTRKHYSFDQLVPCNVDIDSTTLNIIMVHGPGPRGQNLRHYFAYCDQQVLFWVIIYAKDNHQLNPHWPSNIYKNHLRQHFIMKNLKHFKQSPLFKCITMSKIIWKAQGVHNKITQAIQSTQRKRKPLQTETT